MCLPWVGFKQTHIHEIITIQFILNALILQNQGQIVSTSLSILHNYWIFWLQTHTVHTVTAVAVYQLYTFTCVRVIPDFKNELVAAAVGERELNSFEVRGAAPSIKKKPFKRSGCHSNWEDCAADTWHSRLRNGTVWKSCFWATWKLIKIIICNNFKAIQKTSLSIHFYASLFIFVPLCSVITTKEGFGCDLFYYPGWVSGL